MKGLMKILLLGILTVLFFTGCNLFTDPVTSAERLTEFESNLNTEFRTSTYTHIHSGVAVYDQIKTSAWWEASSFSTSNNPFAFNAPQVGGESNGIITHTGTVTYNSVSYSVTITFREEVAGDDVWMIYSINLNSTQIF